MRHGPRSDAPAPGEETDALRRFPAWGSDNRLVETVRRIANDPASYYAESLPTEPGVYVAKVRMSDPAGDSVVVKVVVDADTRDVLAAFPSAGVPDDLPTAASLEEPFAALHGLLRRALAALAASASVCATRNPEHPDSVGTLTLARELLAQGEWEMCLYALTTIARTVGAGPECAALFAEAARALIVDAGQRARAGLV